MYWKPYLIKELTQVGFTVSWRHAFFVTRLRHSVVQIGHHFDFKLLNHLHFSSISGTYLLCHFLQLLVEQVLNVLTGF